MSEHWKDERIMLGKIAIDLFIDDFNFRFLTLLWISVLVIGDLIDIWFLKDSFFGEPHIEL